MSVVQPDQKLVARVMSRMEQLESQQLNFGINNTRITPDVLSGALLEDNVQLSAADVQAILNYQMLQGEVLEIETGVYRSKITETARCIRLVRQRFFDRRTSKPQQLWDSMELVEAIRTEFRPRTRPDRSQVRIDELLENGSSTLDNDLKESLRWTIEEGLGWRSAAGFQRRAFTSIYELSATSNIDQKAVVVAGDTGSGKTEAFLFPILARVAQQKRDLARSGTNILSGVGAVLVYPRIKLALNQLARIAKILKLWEIYGGPHLTIGIQNSEVPTVSNNDYYGPWKEAYQRYRMRIPKRTLEMTLMPCPFEPAQQVKEILSQSESLEEASKLVFEDNQAIQAANQGYPRLVSKDPRYWQPQSVAEKKPHQHKPDDGVYDQLLVTKSALKNGGENPQIIPDILIITDKSLNWYLLQPEYQHLWGIWSHNSRPAIAPPRFLVLDEVHLLNGLNGAHLSRLISRFQARVTLAAQQLGLGRQYAIPIGVSATLYNEAGFMAKVLGMDPNEVAEKIIVRKPNDQDAETKDELQPTSGRERYIFVRPHEIPNPEEPEKRVGSMTAAVQIVMAAMHNLMQQVQGEKLEYKGLAFFDSVNDVNLFESFYNSRGSESGLIRQGANTSKLWSIRTTHICPLTGSPCKAGNTNPAGQVPYSTCTKFLAGDCWVFAGQWGWDKPLKVSRPNYAGVYSDIQKNQLIPTTPALEVGYDDDAIQFVYQHMAPANVASFIQRRGRAGRNPDQSPVIVTLLWPYRTRDLFYFYRPNYLYEPTFDDIPLNARNRYVQLTHAFLAIFDWLAAQTAARGWPGVTGEVRTALSANYTNIGKEKSFKPSRGGSFYTKRWELRLSKLVNWGNGILNIAGVDIQRYLEQEISGLGPGIPREALTLLPSLFQPDQHRIPIPGTQEWNNFLTTFKRIDFDMQGDSGESVIEVTYPKPREWDKREVALTVEERSKEPSKLLERGITELLPGNVTYRLRINGESHWTPIHPDKASTYLYSSGQEQNEALGLQSRYSLKRLKNSLLGIPAFLESLYPDMYYFKPTHLKAERFSFREEDPQWVYNKDKANESTVPLSRENSPRHRRELYHLDTHSQAFASSVIVPFNLEQTIPSQSIQPPKQLDQIFARINAYLDNNVGYLQLFYSYTISPRLNNSGKASKWVSEELRPKLYRLFYGPDSTPEDPHPSMAAYEIHTQGLEFIVSEEFCRVIALQVLRNDGLRMYFRQRFVAYQLGKAVQKIKKIAFSLRYIQLGRVIVAYWLARHVPEHPGAPEQWTLSSEDLPKIRMFVEGTETENPAWSGDQSWITLSEDFLHSEDPTYVDELFKQVNNAIREGFTDSRAFREYLESAVLHSLAVVVKNYCALLGGVLPESLVVYADLPNQDRVSQADQPRILVMDAVSGGSGAIGQAFENITRKPEQLADAQVAQERNLWALLQTELGGCPVGDGETILRNLLLGMKYDECVAFIQEVRQDKVRGPQKLRDKLAEVGQIIQDTATFETVARSIFASEVYVAASSTDSGLPQSNAADEPGTTSMNRDDDPSLLSLQTAIQPPLIVHELLRQEDQLLRQLGYRPQPEIVVAHALGLLGSGTWPYIEQLSALIRRDLATDKELSEPAREQKLRSNMTRQLHSLLPRRCEDGCPVCMTNGSDMEDTHFAPYLNSRQLLHLIQEHLLITSVPESTAPLRDLMQSKPFRLPLNGSLPADLTNTAGALRADTLSIQYNAHTTAVIPATSIDAHGTSRPLSILKGVAVGSQEEYRIASYLDLRNKHDGWLYDYNQLRSFRDPKTQQEVKLRPSFFVQVPYISHGEEFIQEFIVDCLDPQKEGSAQYIELQELKRRCYYRARKPYLELKLEDLTSLAFTLKIEAFAQAEILKQEPEAQFSFSHLAQLHS